MLTYGLVVAQGYVRLVRRGERPPRRLTHTSFVRHGNEWVERGPESDDVLEAEEANEALVHSLGGDDAYWADDPEQLDPYLEAAIDEALHPRRGDTGQSSRSRITCAACSSRCPGSWSVPARPSSRSPTRGCGSRGYRMGGSGRPTVGPSSVAGSAGGVSPWSACG
jgi:hypothetical protein